MLLLITSHTNQPYYTSVLSDLFCFLFDHLGQRILLMPECSADIDGGRVDLAMSRCTEDSRYQPRFISVDGSTTAVVPRRRFL